MSDHDHDFKPGDTCGPYQILRFIDEGGFSEVYAARDTRDGTPSAVKVLRATRGRKEEVQERFQREIKLLAQIKHENVVRFIEAGHQDRRIWLAMELLDGEPLRVYMHRRGPLPLEEALSIAYQAASGVAQAQALGVVHRDLKPENLFRTRAGLIKVLDYGIAKFYGWGLQSTDQARRGLLGTPAYMSPEHIQGEVPGPPSDVYQLALILYEMLSGRYPFGFSNGEMPTQTQVCRL